MNRPARTAAAVLAAVLAAGPALAGCTGGKPPCTSHRKRDCDTVRLAADTRPARGRMSAAQIARVARAAGFRGRNLTMAVAVALAESDGQVRNVSRNPGSRDLGLWQINTRYNAKYLRMGHWADPADNAAMAYATWADRGWRDWSTVVNGRYRRYWARAAAVT